MANLLIHYVRWGFIRRYFFWFILSYYTFCSRCYVLLWRILFCWLVLGCALLCFSVFCFVRCVDLCLLRFHPYVLFLLNLLFSSFFFFWIFFFFLYTFYLKYFLFCYFLVLGLFLFCSALFCFFLFFFYIFLPFQFCFFPICSFLFCSTALFCFIQICNVYVLICFFI